MSGFIIKKALHLIDEEQELYDLVRCTVFNDDLMKLVHYRILPRSKQHKRREQEEHRQKIK